MTTKASRIWRQAVAVAMIGLLSCGFGTALADDDAVPQRLPLYPTDPLPEDEAVEITMQGTGGGGAFLQGIVDALTDLIQSMQSGD